MIENIVLRGVASYSVDKDTVVALNKKINLIYGHNGTGKSTIANYLQEPDDLDYASCSIKRSGSSPDILVYNEKFIDRNFHTSSNQPGVFTLSEGNKDAELAIEKAEKAMFSLEARRVLLTENGTKLNTEKQQKLTALKDEVWKGKIQHDRSSLEFCLDGFRKDKEKFIDQVRSASIEMPGVINEALLLKEATELQSQSDILKQDLTRILSNANAIECDAVFLEVIVGSRDSYLSQLIHQLGNSDWVKNGRQYLDIQKELCPFCQQRLPESFEETVGRLFDETYDSKITELERLLFNYKDTIRAITHHLESAPFLDDYVSNDIDFKLAKSQLIAQLNVNLLLINQKISSPSTSIKLVSTDSLLQSLNDCIDKIHIQIKSFNDRVLNKKAHLTRIKSQFWSLIRAQYSSAINTADNEIIDIETKLNNLRDEILNIRTEATQHKAVISENRAKITNVDLSVEYINSSIEMLGLEGFHLEKESESSHYYRIARDGNTNKVFKTLSEGEKTLISFLYFLERCKGSPDQNSAVVLANRLIVIDDPVTSLSHNYVYDIASIIQHRIIEAGFGQVIILTHSLFFFHELLKLKEGCEDKALKKEYRLLRVTKNTTSSANEINEADIRNDYESYWLVIKDCLSGKASSCVLPNMMRNILEFYFNFVHQKAKLKKTLEEIGENDNEFKPLFRYINRESHSDAININDFGTIDPVRYVEKFKQVFEKTGFDNHFNIMMGAQE